MGEVSIDEMEYLFAEPLLSSYVDSLGVSTNDTHMLFRLMDLNGSGNVDIDEFCTGCLRLQGEAKAVETHTLIYMLRHLMKDWSKQSRSIEARLRGAETRIIQLQTSAAANASVRWVAMWAADAHDEDMSVH